MSTKIYNGYLLPSMSAYELNEFCNTFREKIQNTMKQMLKNQLVSIAVEIIDRKSMNLPIPKEYLKGIVLKNPLCIASQSIQHHHSNIKKTGIRNDRFDYWCDLAILPMKDKIFCIFYSERLKYLQLWEKEKLVTPYPYWNNYDKPDDITEKEWDKRAHEWDEALGKSGIPSMNGFCVDFVHEYLPWFKHEKILKVIPSYEDRIKKMCILLIFNDKEKSKEIKHYNDIKKVIKKYGQSYIDQVKPKLKKEITKDDLINEIEINDRHKKLSTNDKKDDARKSKIIL